jgi:hypothetical protein
MKAVKGVSGYGNYTIEVKGKDGKQTRSVLYFMDSHAYSTLKGIGGYGWMNFDQVEWYRSLSDRYAKANGGAPMPSLAFFHIPLPEYTAVDAGKGFPSVGAKLETVCCPAINTGLCAAMLEKGDMMGVFVGHDHVNDYIFNYYGVALAYGRWSGSRNTYGDLKNGVRMVELTEGEKGFDTWIRLNGDITINHVKFPNDLPAEKK